MNPRSSPGIAFRRRLWNISLLAAGWCCAVGSMFIMVSVGTLAARSFASSDVATVPVGIQGFAAALSSIPGSLLCKRWGKRPVFLAASALGIVGGIIVCIAAQIASFPLVATSAIFQGSAYSISNLYRFAALEFATESFKTSALAITVGGAVLSTFVGPEASRHVRDSLEKPYLGSFVLATCLWTAQFLILLCIDFGLPARAAEVEEAAKKKAVDSKCANAKCERAVEEAAMAKSLEKVASTGAVALPLPPSTTNHSTVQVPAQGADDRVLFPDRIETQHETSDSENTLECGKQAGSADDVPVDEAPRPLLRIIANPVYLTAVYISAMSFFGMAGLMGFIPLAMADAGYSPDDSTLVIEAHMLSMYAPSLVTGTLIRDIGIPRMLLLGTVTQLTGNAVFYGGTGQWVFWLSMILIGLGWNVNFVGASALVTTTYRPSEKFVAQGVFDMSSLFLLSVALVSAGSTYSGVGLRTMHQVYLGFHGSLVLVAAYFALCLSRSAATESDDTNDATLSESSKQPGLDALEGDQLAANVPKV